MTKISTVVVLEIGEALGEYRELERHAYEFDGPVAFAKKGRDQMSQNMKFQQQQAQNAANNAAGYNSDVQKLLDELMGSTTPGSMSPSAAAMYASDLENINSTYNGLREHAFATNGMRGYGNAPSGFGQSAQNALTQGQNAATTGAYRTGIENTAQQRQNALSAAAGMTGAWNNAELGNTATSSNSAAQLNRLGSTLGDILGGASSILGGITGISGLMKNWQGGGNLMMQPQNLATQNLPLSPLSPTFTANSLTPSGLGNY